jgi:hypothetical protein
MKKLFLCGVIALFLMSFASESKIKPNEEGFLSPECWDIADQQLAELAHLPIDYENAHNIWLYYYDVCNLITGLDNFQFP